MKPRGGLATEATFRVALLLLPGRRTGWDRPGGWPPMARCYESDWAANFLKTFLFLGCKIGIECRILAVLWPECPQQAPWGLLRGTRARSCSPLVFLSSPSPRVWPLCHLDWSLLSPAMTSFWKRPDGPNLKAVSEKSSVLSRPCPGPAAFCLRSSKMTLSKNAKIVAWGTVPLRWAVGTSPR